jgi:hypothetical protein
VHVSVRRGCPQGGVLSPLLWNMVADSLLNWLGNCNCSVQGFADDVVIFISGKFISIICDLMQRPLAHFFGAGRVLESFRRNLISRHLSLLDRSPLFFKLRLTPLWLVPTTV